MNLEKLITDEILKSVANDDRFEQVLFKKLADNGIFPNRQKLKTMTW